MIEEKKLFRNHVLLKENKKLILDEVIPPKHGYALEVKKGQFLRVVDVMGKQVSDMVVFNKGNLKEKYAAWFSGLGQGTAGKIPRGITVGDILYSSKQRPMMTITQDTPVPGGIHDLFGGMCSRRGYERRGAEVPEGGGCWDLLGKAVEPYGIAQEEIAQAFNIFMNTHNDPVTGELVIKEPVSRPGDFVEFRAEMDCIVAMTVCPFHGPCNGWVITPLQVQVLE